MLTPLQKTLGFEAGEAIGSPLHDAPDLIMKQHYSTPTQNLCIYLTRQRRVATDTPDLIVNLHKAFLDLSFKIQTDFAVSYVSLRAKRIILRVWV